MRNFAKHPIVVVIGIVASILTIAGYFGWNLDREPKQSSRPTTPAVRHEPIEEESSENAQSIRPSPVTFQELVSFVYEEIHTDIQTDDFLNQHLGRRVTWEGWTGAVSDHAEDGISVVITDKESLAPGFAFLMFPRDYRADLVSLNFGQRIRASCTFVKFDSRAHLEDCDLLKIWSTQKSTQDRGDS